MEIIGGNMTEELIDVAELDCIYLTYDEPKHEEFWAGH